MEQQSNGDDEVIRAFIETSELLTRYRKFAATHPEVEFYTLGNVCFGAEIPNYPPIVRVTLGGLIDDLEAIYRGELLDNRSIPGGLA